MKLASLVATAGRGDIDDMVAAERKAYTFTPIISAPNTAHATSPTITFTRTSPDMDAATWDEPFALSADELPWYRDAATVAAFDAASPALKLRVDEARRNIERLVRLLDAAESRGDLVAIAVIESRLGFSYADRFQAES